MKITQKLLKKLYLQVSIPVDTSFFYRSFLGFPRYISIRSTIHRASFLNSLFAQYMCQFIEVFLDTSLNTSHRSNSSCMHFIYFSCIAFFSLCVHSILLSCFSCRSMVPCSSRSFYVNFLSISGQVFWLFMSFDNRVKK